MSWKPIAYALLCVIAPVAWGLVVYWASNMIERRVLRKSGRNSDDAAPSEEATLPLEYYI